MAMNFDLTEVNRVFNLRILEYEDVDGDIIFAYPLQSCPNSVRPHRSFKDSIPSIRTCMSCNHPPQFCKDRWWSYIINAIDIDYDPKKVQWFYVPSEVFVEIAGIMLKDWGKHAMEPTAGQVFTLTPEILPYSRFEHRITLRDEIYPVGENILHQVINPTTVLGPPGTFISCESESIRPTL